MVKLGKLWYKIYIRNFLWKHIAVLLGKVLQRSWEIIALSRQKPSFTVIQAETIYFGIKIWHSPDWHRVFMRRFPSIPKIQFYIIFNAFTPNYRNVFWSCLNALFFLRFDTFLRWLLFRYMNMFFLNELSWVPSKSVIFYLN